MPEKILIVDDDLDTLKLVGLILQRQGYGIVAANGGNQALVKASAERPDLILLDLMMPDMDGYEVTRRLRADPALAHIPIVLFTAKTLLDDKVAGFEAGADDYLTKPTHPAELVAHVKALLARAQTSQVAGSVDLARMVGFISAKGGVGTTTVALNFAAGAAQGGEDVIVVDLRPGQGSLGLMLGIQQPRNLANLLNRAVADLNPRTVGEQIISHGSGIRVLPASAEAGDVSLASHLTQLEAVVRALRANCKLLVVDLGTGLSEAAAKLAPQCETLGVVADPMPVTITQTKALLADLMALNVSNAKFNVVMVNHAPISGQLSWQKAEQLLGQKVAQIVSPAAEMCHQANEVGTPLVLLRAESLPADQLRQLTATLLQATRARTPAAP